MLVPHETVRVFAAHARPRDEAFERRPRHRRETMLEEDIGRARGDVHRVVHIGGQRSDTAMTSTDSPTAPAPGVSTRRVDIF